MIKTHQIPVALVLNVKFLSLSFLQAQKEKSMWKQNIMHLKKRTLHLKAYKANIFHYFT